jgi:hypothetical protein
MSDNQMSVEGNCVYCQTPLHNYTCPKCKREYAVPERNAGYRNATEWTKSSSQPGESAKEDVKQ